MVLGAPISTTRRELPWLGVPHDDSGLFRPRQSPQDWANFSQPNSQYLFPSRRLAVSNVMTAEVKLHFEILSHATTSLHACRAIGKPLFNDLLDFAGCWQDSPQGRRLGQHI